MAIFLRYFLCYFTPFYTLLKIKLFFFIIMNTEIQILRREITGFSMVGLAWEQKIGTTLWFLATGECFRSIGDRFGMGESTFSYALRDIVNILITKFLSEKIAFPSTELEINEITN